MACTIVGDLTGGNVPVGGGLAFAVTTQPIGAQVNWTGDLGDDLHIFQDGHQLITRWDTPGIKTLTAQCESDSRTVTVFVTPCQVVSLNTSSSHVARFHSVLITANTADTIPHASVDDAVPARKLEWSGDLGHEPQFSGNTLVTHWEDTGEMYVAVTCGGSATATTMIIVS
jgi:hypothetical protein